VRPSLAAAAVALGAALALGCFAADPASPPPTAQSQESAAMHVHDETTLRAALSRYTEHLHRGAADTFEIVLAPGEYRDVDLQVVGVVRPRGSLTLRGAGPGPSILRGAHLDLVGDAIALRGLVIDGTRLSSPALQARIASRLTLEDIAFVGCAGEGDRSMGLVTVTPVAKTGPKTIAVRRAWFVDNTGAPGRVMLGYQPRPTDPLEQLLLEDVAMVGNRFGALVEPHGSVICRRCAAVVDPGGTFAWLRQRDPLLAIEDSAFAAADAAGLVRVVDADGPAAALTIQRSALVFVDGGLPEGVAAEATDVRRAAPPSGGERWARAARAGQAVDIAPLRSWIIGD
jgi:hypothetical protein